MIYFILAAIIVLGDQVFKYWICANLVIDGTKELLPGIVHLTHIENTGAAFSMLSGMRWVLVGVSVFAAIVLIAAIIKTRMGALARISLAFILGGAVGNLVDRVLFGSVVDMFVVDIVKFNGIFNIADIFVVIGCILFCLCYLFGSTKDPKKEKAKSREKEQRRARTSEASFDEEPSTESYDSLGTAEEPSSYNIDDLLAEYHRENDGNR